MRIREVKGMHEYRVFAYIFTEIIRDPATNHHDDVRGGSVTGKVSGTTGTEGLSTDVFWEVGMETAKEPRAGGNGTITVEP